MRNPIYQKIQRSQRKSQENEIWKKKMGGMRWRHFSGTTNCTIKLPTRTFEFPTRRKAAPRNKRTNAAAGFPRPEALLGAPLLVGVHRAPLLQLPPGEVLRVVDLLQLDAHRGGRRQAVAAPAHSRTRLTSSQ